MTSECKSANSKAPRPSLASAPYRKESVSGAVLRQVGVGGGRDLVGHIRRAVGGHDGPAGLEDLAHIGDRHDREAELRLDGSPEVLRVVEAADDPRRERLRLAGEGVRNIAFYDVSHTDVSYLISEAFRCSHLVLAAPTYNGEIYTPMEDFLRDLANHGLRGRTVALIENGTWAARSGMLMTKLLEGMKDMRVLEGTVTVKSAVKEAQRRSLESLADTIADEILH